MPVGQQPCEPDAAADGQGTPPWSSAASAEAPAAEVPAAEAGGVELAATTDFSRAYISCSSLSLLSSRCCTLASHCIRLSCDGSALPTSSCSSRASSKLAGAAGMDGPDIAVDGVLDWLRLPTGDAVIGGRPLAAGRPLDAGEPLSTGSWPAEEARRLVGRGVGGIL